MKTFIPTPIIYLCAALAALAAMTAAQAQNIPPAADPGVIQQRQIEQERRLRQEEELERQPADKPVDTKAVEPSARPIEGEGVRFLVKDVEFGPSELLARDELDALAAPLRGRTVALAEIQRLVAQVNELYRKKGIVTAQAILPPQDLISGIVRIRPIEGRIGTLSVSGNATTNEGYVVARVRQQPGDLVDLPALERDLRRFNRSNDAQARAELKPGAQVGQTDIGLALTEPPLHELKLFSDNSGSEQTGDIRVGAMYRNRSLFGRRDDLALTTVWAEGQDSFSVAYGAPVNTLGTRFNVAYYDDGTEVKNGPFADLRLNGDADAVIASLRHPLLVGAAHQLDVVLGGKRRNTQNRFDDVLLQDTDTSDVSLGIETQVADSTGYWLATVTASRVRSESLSAQKRSFGIWRGTLRRNHNLNKDYAVVGAVNWQYTQDELLPAGEQFLLGGEHSVRGYNAGLLSGDRGYTFTAELHHPINTWHSVRTNGFFFLDYGRVSAFRPAGDPRDNTDSISGAGWGAIANIGKDLSARATFAWALRDRPEQADDHRIMLQLVWNAI